MSNLPEELREGRIGRIPVWVIGVVLAAGFLLFMLWRNRGKSTDADPADQGLYYDPSLVQDQSGLPDDAIGAYLNADPTNPAYPVGLTSQGIPGPITNVQWSRLTFDSLVGKGNDPALVERSLAKYIAGMNLTSQEQAVVNLALQGFGAPPEGLILHDTTSPTGTIPGTTTPPPAGGGGSTGARRYTIVARYTTPNPPWNSTLSGIAAHYGTTVDRLVQINHIANRNLIITGQKIYIDP